MPSRTTRTPPAALDPPPDPLELSPEELLRDGAMTVRQAVAFSGINRDDIFALIRTGAVPSFKRGRSRLIPRRGLQLFLARLHLESNR